MPFINIIGQPHCPFFARITILERLDPVFYSVSVLEVRAPDSFGQIMHATHMHA
jgi:hypothetical protein